MIFCSIYCTLLWTGYGINSGAFSEVKHAINKSTNIKYAIKIIDKSKCRGKENMIETEVNILKKVKHDHIISLYEMFEIDNKIYLVMELYVVKADFRINL